MRLWMSLLACVMSAWGLFYNSRFTVTAEKFLMVFNVYTNIWL